ncbi:protein of unknown function [Formivibrio citricus]|uniref:DUF4202 domain-containing protein n=1 Tax=Formivibrio citricus TaxID=83765 RepID=A0A1I4ZBL1_9NEIS|nr:DUF4202 domain-containing protein [Formivibrio citricus]SFN47587.1 protein of unknown function [Formivibrio citricus]
MTEITQPPRFESCLSRFDAANAEDPRSEFAEGRNWPKELLYGRRMSAMLARFAPQAGEAVQLACRAQHIRRWAIPRQDYPMTREGYLSWRTALYRFHAQTAGEIMREVGYDAAMIEAVGQIVGKRGLKVNPDTQLLEDVAALVFLESYMAGFAEEKADYSEEKWLGIIGKTWKKMSEAGRVFALSGQIALPQALLPLIQKAIQAG